MQSIIYELDFSFAGFVENVNDVRKAIWLRAKDNRIDMLVFYDFFYVFGAPNLPEIHILKWKRRLLWNIKGIFQVVAVLGILVQEFGQIISKLIETDDYSIISKGFA